MGYFLFTADWHIKNDNRIWASRPDITGDLEVAIDQICSIIKQNPPLAVLLGGDTFDSRTVTSYGISLFQKFIQVCRQQNVPIYYVFGQHDISEPPLLSAIDDYCQCLHGRTVTINGKSIAGLNYLPTTGKEPFRFEADYLLTHQVWKEFIPGNAGVFSLAHFTAPNIILSGDYHFPRAYCNGNKILLSPGPLVMQATNQLEPKGFYVIAPDDTWTHLTIASRPVYQFTIRQTEDLTDYKQFLHELQIDDRLPAAIRKPIILVSINPEIAALDDILISDHVHIIHRFLDTGVGVPDYTADVHADHQEVAEVIQRLAPSDEVAKLALHCYQTRQLNCLEEFLNGKDINALPESLAC